VTPFARPRPAAPRASRGATAFGIGAEREFEK